MALVKCAHAYADDAFASLFIRNFDSGRHNAGQLVLNVEPNRVMFRKSPKAPQKASERERFKNEIHAAQMLSFELSSQPGCPARFSTLLGSAAITTPYASIAQQHNVSYWEYLDGGSLKHFINNARSKDVRIPQWFILRYAIQAMETIQFMYTLPIGPIGHHDLHTGNIMLHFGPDPKNKVPAFVLVDFASAGPLRPHPHPAGPLLDLVGIADGIYDMAGQSYGRLDDPTNRYFVAQLYRELKTINEQWKINGFPMAPSLAHTIYMSMGFGGALAMAGEDPDFNAVELSLRPIAYEKMNREPRTHGDRDIALQVQGVPGPWYLAQVKTEDWSLTELDTTEAHHSPL